MIKRNKYGKTIYHVQFVDGTSHFFGSISAIFDCFTSEQIGVSKAYLWNYGITPERSYKNKKCTITRGEIVRKKKNN